MNKKEKNKSIAKKTIFLSIFLIFQQLYLIHIFTRGLFSHYGHSINNLSSIAQISISAVLFLMIAICFLIIICGYYLHKKYTRKFTALYLLWASIFPIWGIIASSNQILNALVLLVNISIMIYLMVAPLKQRYIKTSNQFIIKVKEKFKTVVVNINQHLTNKHN